MTRKAKDSLLCYRHPGASDATLGSARAEELGLRVGPCPDARPSGPPLGVTPFL